MREKWGGNEETTRYFPTFRFSSIPQIFPGRFPKFRQPLTSFVKFYQVKFNFVKFCQVLINFVKFR